MSKKNISRRTFNQLLGATGAATAVGLAAPSVMAAGRGRVVVIGGGFGGATAAKYLKHCNWWLERHQFHYPKF